MKLKPETPLVNGLPQRLEGNPFAQALYLLWWETGTLKCFDALNEIRAIANKEGFPPALGEYLFWLRLSSFSRLEPVSGASLQESKDDYISRAAEFHMDEEGYKKVIKTINLVIDNANLIP